MKILFLAFPHADLYKEIVNEMERKGHEVIVILDSYSVMIHTIVCPN